MRSEIRATIVIVVLAIAGVIALWPRGSTTPASVAGAPPPSRLSEPDQPQPSRCRTRQSAGTGRPVALPSTWAGHALTHRPADRRHRALSRRPGPGGSRCRAGRAPRPTQRVGLVVRAVSPGDPRARPVRGAARRGHGDRDRRAGSAGRRADAARRPRRPLSRGHRPRRCTAAHAPHPAGPPGQLPAAPDGSVEIISPPRVYRSPAEVGRDVAGSRR